MQDYSKMNTNDFSQKDLMLYLLQVAQHSATREDVKEDMSDLKHDISNLATKDELSKVETSLKEDISKVEDKISKVETSLKQDISKVDAKFDKIQWLIIATMMTVLLKDYILSFI